MQKLNLVLIVGFIVAVAMVFGVTSAENKNLRFGVWKLKSDAQPPTINIMTYEPFEEAGMRITVESTNGKGEKRKWSYVTLFDGKYRPVTGDTSTEETAVKIIDAWTNKIMNKRGDRVNIIINVLSKDGKTIKNEYRRIDEKGKEKITHAVYERIK